MNKHKDDQNLNVKIGNLIIYEPIKYDTKIRHWIEPGDLLLCIESDVVEAVFIKMSDKSVHVLEGLCNRNFKILS